MHGHSCTLDWEPGPALMHSTERMSKALQLFDELSDLAAEDRAARLAVLRAEDPVIADELIAMLTADAESDGMLERGADILAATMLGARSRAPGLAVEGRAGQVFGSFVLRSQLGAGGMGEVWLADRQGDDFQQEVALKLLRRGAESVDSLRRFQQERRILAELSHPNIARFIDGGVQEGQPWYAMTRVEGEPITDYARRQGLDVRRRVELMLPVCEAVAFAQSRLVVHRDLKPSNIMVDSDGHPQLLDFGIAKLLELPADVRETATGFRALSPAYAAPEQVLGEAISTATDVYALGIVLYELLTGRLPHDRHSASLETLAESVRMETTERPSLALRRHSDSTGSALSISRQAREVAGELDLIVLTAMRREPERRYSNAAALGEDLQRWLDGRPIAAQADTASYRARKFVSRHRLAVGSASAVLLALIAGFGAALWQASVARSEAARAEAQAEAAREQTARVKRVKDFLMSIFVSEDPLRRASGAPLSLSEAYTNTLQRIDTEFADDPALQADLLDDFGEIEAGRGDLAAAERLIERALAMAEKAYGPNHPAVAESLLNLGVLANYRGHAVAGKARLERAIAILEPLAETEHEALGAALSGLSAVYHHEGRMDVVIDLSRRALAAMEAAPTPDQRRLAVMRNNLALALLEEQRLEESEAEVLQAIALTEQVNGSDSANLAPMLEMLEQIRHAQGDLDAERAMAERRLAIVQGAFPGDHEWIARALGESGYFMARDGQVESGDARMRESIAMYERLDDKRRFQVQRRFGILLAGRGDLLAARLLLEQALENCTALRPNSVPCHTIRANRAEVLARLGEHETALVEADAALAALGDILGARSELNQAREARAAALAGMGRSAEAQQEQAAALDSYRRLLPASHPTVQRSEAKLKALQPES